MGETTGQRFWQMAGWAGLGALLALGWAWARPGRRASSASRGEPVVWLCDRDGGALVGLDNRALEVERRRVAWPLEVAAGEEGELWVLAAADGPGNPGRRLSRVGVQGARGSPVVLGRARNLGIGPFGSARLLVEAAGEQWLVQVNRAGALDGQIPAGNAIGWEPMGKGLALVGPNWVRWHMPGTRAAEQRLPVGAAVLAHGSRMGHLWLLVAPGENPHRSLQVWRWAPRENRPLVIDLGIFRDLGGGRWLLVPIASELLWVLRSAGGVYRVEFPLGNWSRIQLESSLHQAQASEAGGLWALSSGGVQRLNRAGLPLPGQGGLTHLVNLAPAGPAGMRSVLSTNRMP